MFAKFIHKNKRANYITMPLNKRLREDNNIIDEVIIDEATIDDDKTKFHRVENMWDNLTSCKESNNDLWISASKIRNYLMDDPIIDWLELYYGRETENMPKNPLYKNDNGSNGLKFLFERGLLFEKSIYDTLKLKYGDSMKMINETGINGINDTNFTRTKDAIFQNVPIICQGVFYNSCNNTYGCIDLMIRSDYLNKIFSKEIVTTFEETIIAPKLKKYHYRVVDIKWTTLLLRSKMDTIKKSGFFPAYKGQMAIYNSALGTIQGYTPDKAYIMGKGWSRVFKKEELHNRDSFDLLGIIDYSDIDNEYIAKTINAIKWYRDVHKNGSSWSPFDPPNIKRKELYPNMSQDNDTWNSVKKYIAQITDEVTQICNVGINERNCLHKKSIYTIKDPQCNSTNMGLNGNNEISCKIDNICDINRDTQYNIYPRKIQNNYEMWQNIKPNDMYFDYETISSELINSTEGTIAFMIGVGYVENNIWTFKVFTMNNISPEEEIRTMDEFTNFVLKKSRELNKNNICKTRLFHWSPAELTVINDLNYRYQNRWKEWEQQMTFIDMMRVFLKESICVKGALNYSLKTIGNAMYSHGYVNTVWDSNSNVSNGKSAMFEATIYYLKNNRDDSDVELFNDIIKYNEIDCKMIWEIVEYLRKNHYGVDD